MGLSERVTEYIKHGTGEQNLQNLPFSKREESFSEMIGLTHELDSCVILRKKAFTFQKLIFQEYIGFELIILSNLVVKSKYLPEIVSHKTLKRLLKKAP